MFWSDVCRRVSGVEPSIVPENIEVRKIKVEPSRALGNKARSSIHSDKLRM